MNSVILFPLRSYEGGGFTAKLDYLRLFQGSYRDFMTVYLFLVFRWPSGIINGVFLYININLRILKNFDFFTIKFFLPQSSPNFYKAFSFQHPYSESAAIQKFLR